MITRTPVRMTAIGTTIMLFSAVALAYRPIRRTSADPPPARMPSLTTLPIATASDLSSLTAAPLFNARRSFTPEPPKPDLPAVQPTPPPQLMGLIASSAGGSLVVVRDAGESQKLVLLGAIVQGWRLAAIEHDAAVFQRGPNRVRSRLIIGGAQAKAGSSVPTGEPSPAISSPTEPAAATASPTPTTASEKPGS